MSNDQIDELYGKGSLDKIKQYHRNASAVSTDSYDAKSYHDASVKRTEFLGKREKAKVDIAKAKKGSTREKSWRNYLQSKDDSERQRNWSQKHRSKLSSDEKRIHNTYLKAKGVQEDAPTVNAGSGNIAGIGVGPKGEPGVRPKDQAKNKSPILYPEMMRRTVPNMVKETQLDELSRKTLSNYIKKASDSRAKNQGEFDFYYKKKNSKKYGKAFRNVLNRRKGIRQAASALVKENQIDELYGKGSVDKIRSHHYKQANDIAQADEKRMKKNPNPSQRVNNPYADDAISHHISKVRKADRIKKKLVAEETFAGAKIFEVSSKLFHNLTLQKRKGKHWRTYLEEDDCYAEIREWARKSKGSIVVRNESTGEMRYVRYSKG